MNIVNLSILVYGWKKPGKKHCRIIYIDQDEELKQTHYDHLNAFLENEIKIVTEEQSLNNEDQIDRKVALQRKAQKYKCCYKCSFDEIPKLKHTCPMCQTNVTKAKMKAMGLDDNENALTSHTHKRVLEEEIRVHVRRSTGEKRPQNISYDTQAPRPRKPMSMSLNPYL